MGKKTLNDATLSIRTRLVGPASTPSIARSPDRDTFNDAFVARTRSTTALHRQSRLEALERIQARSSRATSITTAALFPTPRSTTSPSVPSMMSLGITLLAGSIALWIIGFYIVGMSSSMEPTGWRLLDAISEDRHYKYVIPLQITAGLVFVIVNWGGLKMFRHS